jgi:hypothetical protein
VEHAEKIVPWKEMAAKYVTVELVFVRQITQMNVDLNV